MKQKLKKFLLPYLLIGTLFVSCTMEEEAIRNHNYSKDIKIYQKSFDELIKDSKFVTSFNKLPKRKTSLKSSAQARTVMEEQYGFTILDSPARVMQVGNLTSYTFHIERNTPNENYFENLVVQNDSIGNTTAHIIKYTPFMPMTSYTEHNSYSFTGNTEFTSIIYDDNNINGKMVLVCKDLYGFRCTGSFGGGSSCTASPHIPMGGCTEYTPECIKYTLITQSCTSYDDGLTDISTGGGVSSGSGQAGGGGTGGNTTIISDPLCPTCPEFTEDNPCIRLVNKTSSTAYKQKFKDLNVPANYTSTQESGFGEVITGGISQYIDGIPNGHSELIPPLGSINLTHIHNNIPLPDDVGTFYESRIKILAPGDISVLARKCQIANTDPTEAFVVMASDEGVFAISITEEFVLNGTTVSTDLWNNFRLNYDKRGIAINTDPYLDAQSRRAALQIMLLEELKIIGLENKIALFEGTIENENDSDINNYNIKWTQKKLGKNFFGVAILKPTPCN